jgi:hypothetical protein
MAIASSAASICHAMQPHHPTELLLPLLQVAILQVVFDIQLQRRRQSMDTERPPDNGPEASSTTSIGSTVA